MDKKTFIEKIKALFESEVSEESFETTLSDGTNVVAKPSMEVGSEIFKVTAESTKAVEDGDYEMESGDIVSVKAGKIEDIKKKLDESEVEKGSELDLAKEVEDLKTELSSIKDSLKTLLEKSNEAEVELKKAKDDKEAAEKAVDNIKQEVGTLISEFSKIPAEETSSKTAPSARTTSRERALMRANVILNKKNK